MGEYYNKINQYGNKEIARYLLIEQCGIILATMDRGKKLFKVAYDYLFNGCENRRDYEYLVKVVFNHAYDEWCVDVLLNGGLKNDK